MIESHRKLIPNVPTDHITKQGIYASLLSRGASEEAKKTFRRPPYYRTVAAVKPIEIGEHSDDVLDEVERKETDDR